jgi:MFS family permease
LAGKGKFPTMLIATIWLGWIFVNQSIFILNPILPIIEEFYQILHVQSGWLVGSYMIGYAIMQLFAGYFGDRFGEERFLIIAVFGTSVSTVVTWKINTLMQLYILRLITGLFAGMYYAPSNSLISKTTTHQQRGKALGLVFSSAGVSSLLTYTLIGILILLDVSWQDLFLVFGSPGILFTPLFVLLLTKTRLTSRYESEGTECEEEANTTILQTMQRRVVLNVLLFNFLTSLTMWSLNAFLPIFFVNVRGLTVSEASFLLNAASASGILCMPFGGYLTDKFGFKIPSYISLLVLGATSVYIPIFQIGVHTVITFILWGFLGGMANTAVMTLLADIVPFRIRGTFFGVLNFVGWIGGTIGSVLLGHIIDLYGFISFFSIILIIYLGSTVIISVIRP